MKQLLPLIIGLWSATALATFEVDTCDADWLRVSRFKELLSVEVAQYPELETTKLQIAVTQCTVNQVTLVVTYRDTVLSAPISLIDTPPENRLRTAVLAVAELLEEINSQKPANNPAPAVLVTTDDQQDAEIPMSTAPVTPLYAPPPSGPRKMPVIPEAAITAETPSAKPTTGHEVNPTTQPAMPKASAPKEDAPTENRKTSAASTEVPPLNRTQGDPRPAKKPPVHYGAHVSATVFPLQKTIAPELHLCILRKRLLIGAFVAGRSWKDRLGRAIIVGASGFTGLNLWKIDGPLTFGGDVLAELGAIYSRGKASTNAWGSKDVNFAFGGRTQIWLRTHRDRTGFQTTLGVGWIRGLNVWAADRKLGGFHGFLASLGVGIIW